MFRDLRRLGCRVGGFKQLLVRGPHHEDYRILGCISGNPSLNANRHLEAHAI